MENFIKADVFFFITAIAVVLVTLVLILVLLYLVKVLKNVFYVSREIRRETDLIVKDIDSLRKNIREGGGKVKEDIIEISSRFRKEGESTADDFKLVREGIKSETGRLGNLFTFLLNFFRIKKERSKRKVTRKSKNKKND